MNEVTFQTQRTNDSQGYSGSVAMPSPGGVAPSEDLTQRYMMESRRELLQELAVRRGPSLGEGVLALGSLTIGAVVTAVLVNGSTTVVSGYLGSQHVTQTNTLPLIIVVWAALFLINVAWMRRR